MVEQTNNHYQPSLNWVELSWFELRVDEYNLKAKQQLMVVAQLLATCMYKMSD